MNIKSILPNHLNGRNIFSKVIPTVNSLSNLFNSLDKNDWNYDNLKNWEKPIYNAYNLDKIKSKLKIGSDYEKPAHIKTYLLQQDPNNLGAHPICIYLIAYFIQETESKDFEKFKTFVINKGISEKEGSATAIWNVGTSDGKYLGLFDKYLNILDWTFFEKWSTIKSKNELSQLFQNEETNLSQKNKHLTYFLNINDETKWIGSVNSYQWAQSVLESNTILNDNLNQKFYRDDLFEYCSNLDNTDWDTLIAILSWGGMHREHAYRLLSSPDVILDIVNKLRNNFFTSRKEAFTYIQNKRNLNFLPGLGVGYYTKLICFLAPDLNGYIMDQWLAKSINLIIDNKKIKIDSNSWVTDDNDENTYEYFCQEVDKIATYIGVSGFKTEEKLFSIGGKTKGIWRKYVVDNY